MSEGYPPEPDDESLRNLGTRLNQARAERDASVGSRGGKLGGKPGESSASGGSMSGYGMAFRIGTELVAAVALGVVIGLLLDRWLETAPLFLVVFIFLGGAAGMLNVYRVAKGMGLAAGYRPPSNGDRENTGDQDS